MDNNQKWNELVNLINGKLPQDFSDDDYWNTWETIYSDDKLKIEVRMVDGEGTLVSIYSDAWIEFGNEIFDRLKNKFPNLKRIKYHPETLADGNLAGILIY